MRRVVPVFAFLATTTAASLALADGKCPPGAWFCADVTVGPNDASTPRPPDAPPPGGEPKADAKKVTDGGETKKIDGSQGTTVQAPGGTTVIVNTAPPPPEAKPAPPPPPPRAAIPAHPPRYEPAPPPAPPRYRSEWGFNMRLEGAMIGGRKEGAHPDAGMGGVGFSLRARPVPHFALDLGLDFLGGKDFQGHRRSEVPFTVNAMLFVNPKSKTQFYFLGGVGWSGATVETLPNQYEHWSYFGVQGGFGLEFRVSRSVALNIDMIGFVRGRTDEAARRVPEFTDPDTGRTTNTSGGGLLRGGLTIYW